MQRGIREHICWENQRSATGLGSTWGRMSSDTHSAAAHPQACPRLPVTLFPTFPQPNIRAVSPPSSCCGETSTPVHHPAQHGGLSKGRNEPVPRGNHSGSAWEGNPERSHNLRIHPRLGGRNFCTSEQARLSQERLLAQSVQRGRG